MKLKPNNIIITMEILEVLRAIIGFFLVMFIPGFAATYALFPDKKEIDAIERIALSIGLSIALVVLGVFALNMLFGMMINAINSVLVILVITLACAAVGYVRACGVGKTKKEKADTG